MPARIIHERRQERPALRADDGLADDDATSASRLESMLATSPRRCSPTRS
jgi:hypothetical protein